MTRIPVWLSPSMLEVINRALKAAVLSPEDAEKPIHSDNDPVPAELALDREPPEAHDEAPPTIIVWSNRYKEARKFTTGDDETPPDFEKARLLLLEEAQSGNTFATFDPGKLSGNGLGQSPDEKQAQIRYVKALTAFQAASILPGASAWGALEKRWNAWNMRPPSLWRLCAQFPDH